MRISSNTFCVPKPVVSSAITPVNIIFPLKFSTLLNELKTRMEIIVTFLAILDLVREGICSFEQNGVFDEIELIHLGVEA